MRKKTETKLTRLTQTINYLLQGHPTKNTIRTKNRMSQKFTFLASGLTIIESMTKCK